MSQSFLIFIGSASSPLRNRFSVSILVLQSLRAVGHEGLGRISGRSSQALLPSSRRNLLSGTVCCPKIALARLYSEITTFFTEEGRFEHNNDTIPDHLQDAAAVLVNYTVAHALLFDVANVRKGQTVLVHSIGKCEANFANETFQRQTAETKRKKPIAALLSDSRVFR